METRALVICISLGSLGFISAILSFAAEARKVKILEFGRRGYYGYPYDYYYYCSPNKIEATVLAIVSASLLLVAQIMMNAVTGCFCCRRHPNITSGNHCVALFCYIFSWVTFLVGFMLSVVAACINANFYSDGCETVRNGTFVAGGLFSLATVALGILCYIRLSSPSENNGGASDSEKIQGTEMGQSPPQESCNIG